MTLQTTADEIPKMISSLQYESIDCNQLLNGEKLSITTSARSSATATANKLEHSGHESEGTYVNWTFDDNEEFYLLPVSDLRIMLTRLESLDVTVKTLKAEGMNLISQFLTTSESIAVTRNRRFPLNGYYFNSGCKSSKFQRNSLQKLYDFLENIENDCVDINYNHSKSVISDVFSQIVKDKGWTDAYDYALNHFAFPIKSPQSHLDKYLKFLCCFVNMTKDCAICLFEVFNVTTFEMECRLTWKETEQ